jgi:hypothetical protein
MDPGSRSLRSLVRDDGDFPIQISNSQFQTHVRIPAARCTRVLHNHSPKKSEGVGNAGCPLHPQPRVQSVGGTRVSSPRSHRNTRHSRTRVVLTVSFGLSPVIGLVCHRRLRNCFRRLDASVEASGPHDFAVREPVLSSAAPSASTASRPASVTTAIRPSCGVGRRGI